MMEAERAKQLESAMLAQCEMPTPGLYERTKKAVPDIKPEEYWTMRKKLYNEGLIEQTCDYCLSPTGEIVRNRTKGAA